MRNNEETLIDKRQTYFLANANR